MRPVVRELPVLYEDDAGRVLAEAGIEYDERFYSKIQAVRLDRIERFTESAYEYQGTTCTQLMMASGDSLVVAMSYKEFCVDYIAALQLDYTIA
jgi:hypothetical protein